MAAFFLSLICLSFPFLFLSFYFLSIFFLSSMSLQCTPGERSGISVSVLDSSACLSVLL